MRKGPLSDPEFFFEFLKGQGFFLLLIMILSGSGLIANDRKFRALPIYFSKPVGFWDYVTGKWLIAAFYGSLVTLVPGLILFLMKALLSRDSTFIKTYFWMPFSIMGIVLVVLVVLGGLMLCLSAASRGSRPAGIVFFGCA